MVFDTSPSTVEPILIVGAGVFGLSTALELKKRGYQHVTVLDRYPPPVPDGSSVDISRVIRIDYADSVYAKMAFEAYQGWNTEFKDHYHHSGFVMLANQPGNEYLEKSVEIAKSLGRPLDVFDEASDVRTKYPSIPARLEGLKAYANVHGGWADAASSIRLLGQKCTEAGVKIVAGKQGTVTSLTWNGKQVTGVKLATGSSLSASNVILATGAWSNLLMPIEHASTASGQPVGYIQLTPEEAEPVRTMPVMINLSTGLFCFPPAPETNILKVVRHSYGFATEISVNDSRKTVSSPKLDRNNALNQFLPDDAEEALREGLRQLVPAFADRPWMNKRLCWYSDTPEGDFIIDYHPDAKGLFFATGGAGHAFKFLPVLGKYVVDCLENKTSNEIRYKWRFREASRGTVKFGDGSRGGPPLRVLSEAEQARL